jgi:hypothetical protein
MDYHQIMCVNFYSKQMHIGRIEIRYNLNYISFIKIRYNLN